MLVGKIQQYKPPERVTGKGAQHWAKNNTQNEKPEEVFDSDANFNKEGFFFSTQPSSYPTSPGCSTI